MSYDLGIEQTIHFPTRKTKTLDIFFTNTPSTLLSAKPLPGLGDHDIILAEIKIKPDRLRPTKREILIGKKVDIVKIKIEAMKAVNRLIAKEINNIEESLSTFKYCLHTIIQKHVPSKLSSTKYTKPWANTNISHLARKKDRVFKKAKHSGRETHWAKFREVRSLMQREVRRAKRHYLNDVISPQLHENPKRFWSYIKSKRNESTRVASLRNTDGLLYNDSQTQANILNNQFKSAYTIEDTNTIPVVHGSDHPVMNKIHITTNGVRKLLEGIKTHKATGPYNIPAHLLRILSHQLAHFLTFIPVFIRLRDSTNRLENSKYNTYFQEGRPS